MASQHPTHPVDALVAWYKSQIKGVQNSVFRETLCCMPRAVDDPDMAIYGDHAAQFLAWAERLKLGDFESLICQLVSFRACNSFFCMDLFNREKYWNDFREGQEKLLLGYGDNPRFQKLAASAKDKIASMETNRGIWEKARAEWLVLLSNELSDAYLWDQLARHG